MTKTVQATLVGRGESGDTVTLRLEEPLELPADARIMLTVEAAEDAVGSHPPSFLDVVQGLKLDGPSDLSTRLHEYLYGDDDEGR